MMGLDNPAFQDISYSFEEKRSTGGGSNEKSPNKIGKPPKADELIKIIQFEPPIERSV
jgi:hypothetical protein